MVTLAAVISGAVYRTQYKIRKLYGGKFFVKSLKKETADTFTLTLRQEKPLIFRAGQFCFLRLQKDSLHARHPFTIASAPGQKDLEFTIKNSGRFTASATRLRKGERVMVDGPFGQFYLRDGKQPLVFIAGGVGITPFMSILRERLLTSKQQGTNNSPKIHRAGRKITLLYGSRTYNDIIFREEIDRIRAPWFKKRYLLSQEKTKASAKLRKDCLSGYIDEKVIRRFVPEPAEALFYICGPEALKKSVQTVLRRLKVPRQAIFFEDFFW
jgi:predicted ferric reductase